MTISLRIKKFLPIMIVLALCIGCNPQSDHLADSENFYIIDNQSSEELVYNSAINTQEFSEVVISPQQKAPIERVVWAFSDQPFGPDEFYASEFYEGLTVFLKKRTNNEVTNALNLSEAGVLNWQVLRVRDHLFEHTLVISDAMLLP